MQVKETSRNTTSIIWRGGQLEVNLVPVNKFLKDKNPKTTYACPRWENKLMYVHDNVGIVNLQLDGSPQVPRICWDNREHHFWKGFSGGFEPRNTIINDPQIFMDANCAVAACYYIANFVKTSIKWIFSDPVKHNCLAFWDTFFTFENVSVNTLEDYMAFFASYHQTGQNYFWSVDNEIAECADSFRGFSGFDFDEKTARDDKIKKKFMKTVKNWHGIENATKEDAVYMNPVLLSGKKDYYADGRHIIFVEPEKCLNIVSAANQARDYTLAPPQRDLAPGGSFSVRVRHVIAKVEKVSQLEKLWTDFKNDIVGSR